MYAFVTFDLQCLVVLLWFGCFLLFAFALFRIIVGVLLLVFVCDMRFEASCGVYWLHLAFEFGFNSCFVLGASL